MIGVLVLGGLSGIDRTAFAQTMLAHPVVCGTLSGWVAGDPESGLRLGLVLGMFASRRAPIGGEGPVIDWTSASIAAPFGLGGVAAGWQWGLALVGALLWALLGGQLIRSVRRLAAARENGAVAAAAAGDLGPVERLHLGFLGLHAVRGALWAALGSVLLGVLVFDLPWSGPEQAAAGTIWALAPVAGAIVLLHAHWRHAGRAPVALGVGAGAVLVLLAGVLA